MSLKFDKNHRETCVRMKQLLNSFLHLSKCTIVFYEYMPKYRVRLHCSYMLKKQEHKIELIVSLRMFQAIQALFPNESICEINYRGEETSQ